MWWLRALKPGWKIRSGSDLSIFLMFGLKWKIKKWMRKTWFYNFWREFLKKKVSFKKCLLEKCFVILRSFFMNIMQRYCIKEINWITAFSTKYQIFSKISDMNNKKFRRLSQLQGNNFLNIFFPTVVTGLVDIGSEIKQKKKHLCSALQTALTVIIILSFRTDRPGQTM